MNTSVFERALAAIRDIVLIVCGVIFIAVFAVSAAALTHVVNDLQKPAVAQPCLVDPDAPDCGR